MKVLMLSNGSSGLYGFRKELISELLKNNSVILSARFSGFESELCEMGCQLIDTPMERRGKNPFQEFSLILNYFKQIKRLHPDLVITYTIKPNLYGGLICRILNIPYAVNITGLGTVFQNQGLLRKAIRLFYIFSLKKLK